MHDLSMNHIIIICLVILAIILVVSVIARLFKLATVILILMLIVPPLISILCGNGAGYVEKISSVFTPEIQQQINDGYRNYSELEKQDPVLNEQGVKDALGDLWEKTKSSVSGAISGVGHFSDEPE